MKLRWAPDQKALEDLAHFAALEVEAVDLDPWERLLNHVIREQQLPVEEAHWILHGYNTWDALGQAFTVHARWPTLGAWSAAPDQADAAKVPIGSSERRNLYGGKVLRRLDSTAAHVEHSTLDEWLRVPLAGADPGQDFEQFTVHVRQIWGVGRQAAFEWAETVAKGLDWPMRAGDAQLWESEGPRRSLQRLYGEPKPSPGWLDHAAHTAKDYLKTQGVDLSWEDFETVICDFNVMRDGRYYVGRHLAGLAEEITETPQPARSWLESAWAAIVPPEWAGIEPGAKKHLMQHYRNTGKLLTAPA